MKWKCAECIYGPCVYESACDDNIAAITEKCPRAFNSVVWKIMCKEKPEREDETGLPEWLKVGNFIYMDPTNQPTTGDVRLSKGIFKIADIEGGYNLMLESRYDKHFFQVVTLLGRNTIARLNMRHVFPKPYTFETAPVILKVRRKEDGMKDIMRLKLSAKNGAYWDDMFGYRSISYDELLQNWEQLDGWPVGTFEEEEAGNER